MKLKPVLEFAGHKFHTCSKCKNILEETNFDINTHRVSGVYPSCKSCRSLAWERTKNSTAYKLRVEKMKVATRCNMISLRYELINKYSNGLMKCMCPGCDIKEYKFLSIDHIDGGGNKHRKGGNIGKGFVNVYSWLKRNNYPPGFQVLCHNCNLAKGFYGQCPHLEKAATNAS